MSSPVFRRLLALAAVLVAVAPASSQACAVCMGASENTGEALNSAIFVMLGCIGSMMACIGGAAFSIWRRGKNLPPEDDDHKSP